MLVQDLAERPKDYNLSTIIGGGRAGDGVVMQAWHATGEECPEGTVAIRRTMEKDLLRASSLRRYGRKPMLRGVRRDSTSNAHEVSVSYNPCSSLPSRCSATACIIVEYCRKNISKSVNHVQG
jgi:hypothetical protein